MTFIEETPPPGLAGAAVKLPLMLDSDLGILDGIKIAVENLPQIACARLRALSSAPPGR